mmetsp:Transcript_22059/g.40527  ORF Transcript_22059/g.40527 Transcript_22059/m.40527 type:complete len:101 (+) Transcript_22059:131-433(+)
MYPPQVHWLFNQAMSWYSVTSPQGRIPGQSLTALPSGITSAPWTSFSLPMWSRARRWQHGPRMSWVFWDGPASIHVERPDSIEIFKMWWAFFRAGAKVSS